MKLEYVEALIALAKKEGLSELKYETKEVKISVSLPYGSLAPANYLPHRLDQISSAGGSGEIQKTSSSQKEEKYHEIKSPFVGTFYTSSSPTEASYAKIGDRVKKGQVLCIVEAMKIMNEIDSDIHGEVIEICVENESLVEYGQVLFLIKA